MIHVRYDIYQTLQTQIYVKMYASTKFTYLILNEALPTILI